MNPPTEQLVRDYLNRLSVAARGRLGRSDRQALLDQTRARIEVAVGSLRDATAVQVRRALATLGDPVALVENERARLAGRKNGAGTQVWPTRGASGSGSGARSASGSASGSGSGSGQVPPAAAEPAFDLQVPGQLPVTAGRPVPAALSTSQVSADPPPVAGQMQGPGQAPVAGRAPVPVGAAGTAWPHPVNGAALPGGWPPPDGRPRPGDGAGRVGRAGTGGTSDPGEIPPRPPRPRPVPAPETSGGTPEPPAGRRPPRLPRVRRVGPAKRTSDPDASPASVAGAAGRTGNGPPDEPGHGIEFSVSAAEPADGSAERRWLGGAGGALAASLSRLGSELREVATRDWLEAIALVLLGLGGAVYPPIWLIGVLVALISRKWDRRDKWLGLAGPVLLVIFGATLVMVLGGERASLGLYAHEAWLAAGRISRFAAVLGAGYLLRRVHKYKGKRQPRVPPWAQKRKTK